MIKAYRLFTGPDGHSHVETGRIEEEVVMPAKAIRVKETPPHGTYDWHPAPTTQFVITLSGTLEFEMHSGKTFILKPGDILIALDTTGSGHKWKLIDNDPWRRVYVPFTSEADIKFIPDAEPA